MNWLALNVAQVAALWTAAAAVAVALYLLHQRPRHKFVSTLRFWQSLEASAQPRRRMVNLDEDPAGWRRCR